MTEERDTMAVTLNQQKGDLTDMGSRLAQTQKRLDEAELAREELTSELCVANERAQVHKKNVWLSEVCIPLVVVIFTTACFSDE